LVKQTPPQEAFFYDLVEESRLVGVELFENCPHERLTDKTAAVRHSVGIAEAVEGAQFTLVQQDRDAIFTGRLFQLIINN